MKEYRQKHRFNENARGSNLLVRGTGAKHSQVFIKEGTHGGVLYGYQLLATQIIKRAVDDYILQTLKVTRNKRVKAEKLNELKTFFLGELFIEITGFDGDDFLIVLNKKIEKSLQNNNPVL